jgi:anti-sigma regulatory factor (Ser/Thr protein kinase)
MQLLVGKGDQGLRALAGAVDDFCSSHGVADDVRHDLHVALDEIVNNVVRHAAPRHPRIEVRLAADDTHVEVVIVDDGEPFDLHDAPAPDVTLPIEQRRVGGLGVYLVRQLMDDVVYRRSDGDNRLTLRRRLRGPRLARGPASAL